MYRIYLYIDIDAAYFIDLDTSANWYVWLTYLSESWTRFQDNTWIAVTLIISTEFWIQHFFLK